MVYTRLTRLPGRSFFLFGVRGVGKSSWARTTLPDALRLVRRILIYDGERAFRTEDGIDVWPVKQLLNALQTNGVWP